MSSVNSHNSTRLSSALFDIPLTPFGMKNKAVSSQTKCHKSQATRSPSSKLSRQRTSPLADKLHTHLPLNKENIKPGPTTYGHNYRRKEFVHGVSLNNQEGFSSSTMNDYNPRESVCTDIDDGSFVEFVSDNKNIYVYKEPKQPFYYTCDERNDTCFSTSSKMPLPTVGFRKFVDTYRKERRLKVIEETDDGDNGTPEFLPDESVVAGSIDIFKKPHSYDIEVLNSTSRNSKCAPFVYPDLSSLTLDPDAGASAERADSPNPFQPMMSNISRESVEIIESSSAESQFSLRISKSQKRSENEFYQRQLPSSMDSIFSEDVDVAPTCSHFIETELNSEDKARAHDMNKKSENLPIPSKYNQNENLLGNLPTVVSKNKPDKVLNWVLNNPLTDAPFSTSFMNDDQHSLDADNSCSPKDSQNLCLRLSGESSSGFDLHCKKDNSKISAGTICKVSLSPNRARKSKNFGIYCESFNKASIECDKGIKNIQVLKGKNSVFKKTNALHEQDSFVLSDSEPILDINRDRNTDSDSVDDLCFKQRLPSNRANVIYSSDESEEDFSETSKSRPELILSETSQSNEKVKNHLDKLRKYLDRPCSDNSIDIEPILDIKRDRNNDSCNGQIFKQRLPTNQDNAIYSCDESEEDFSATSKSKPELILTESSHSNEGVENHLHKLRRYLGRPCSDDSIERKSPLIGKPPSYSEAIIVSSSDEVSDEELFNPIRVTKKDHPNIILSSDENNCTILEVDDTVSKTKTKSKKQSKEEVEYSILNISSSDCENLNNDKLFKYLTPRKGKPKVKVHSDRTKKDFKGKPKNVLNLSSSESDSYDSPNLGKNYKIQKPKIKSIKKPLYPKMTQNGKSNWRELNTNSSSDSVEDLRFNKGILKYLTPRREPKPSLITENYLSTPVIKTTTHPKTLSFLGSLSSNANLKDLHHDSKAFVKNFKKHKDQLIVKLYEMFNANIFEKKLPQTMKVTWNSRLTHTAGLCYNQIDRSLPNGRNARIELSPKVIDSCERLRDTFIHELCHAATWIISGIKNGHGHIWKAWAYRATKVYPELPSISRCHSYQIAYKYTYKCTKCGSCIGRHSKSLDISKKVCGICKSKFELIINDVPCPTKNYASVESGSKTENYSKIPKTPRTPGPFAMFVKENYRLIKGSNKDMKHADVMKELGEKFSRLKADR